MPSARRCGPAAGRWSLPAILIPLLAVAPACRTVTGPDGEEELRGVSQVLSLELGTTTPLHGDILKGAETSYPAVTLTSVQPIVGPLSWQAQFSFLRVVEHEDDVSYGGFIGDFRQDTESYGLTLGPRLSWAALPRGAAAGSAGMEIFGDAGIGIYLTQITGRFPRGTGDSKYSQWTWDVGASLGTGAVYHLGESFFLGLSLRYHVVFLRISRGESFFDAEQSTDAAVADAIFADSGGGRSDNLGFLAAGLNLGVHF